MTEPCLNGGDCVNTDGGYICNCTDSYIGTDCETGKYLLASDSLPLPKPLVNDMTILLCSTELVCSYHHQSTCGDRGTCEAGRYMYACTCDTGYTGTECADCKAIVTSSQLLVANC